VIEPLVEERRRLAERLAAGLPERQDPDNPLVPQLKPEHAPRRAHEALGREGSRRCGQHTLLSAKAPPGYINFTGSSIPT
jgi:hypothetical protein